MDTSTPHGVMQLLAQAQADLLAAKPGDSFTGAICTFPWICRCAIHKVALEGDLPRQIVEWLLALLEGADKPPLARRGAASAIGPVLDPGQGPDSIPPRGIDVPAVVIRMIAVFGKTDDNKLKRSLAFSFGLIGPLAKEATEVLRLSAGSADGELAKAVAEALQSITGAA